MFIPLLIFRKWNLLLGVVAGFLIFMLITLALFGVPVWRSYFSAMRYHEKPNLGEAQMESLGFEDRNVEGVDNLKLFLPFPNINTSIQYFFKRVFHLDLSSQTLLALLGLTVLIISAFIFRYRTRRVSLATIFLAGSVMMLVSEYFLPAIKAYYSNILWFIPFALIVMDADILPSIKTNRLLFALFMLLAGLFFSLSILWESYDVLIGEAAIVLFFASMAAFLLQASPKGLNLEICEAGEPD
jgi:hypothetical protein